MTTHDNSGIRRYLEEFEGQLEGVDEAERAEMVHEIENHIAESMHDDGDLSVALEKLGPAARLADAYRVELALGTDAPRRSWARTAGFLALLATTSLPSFTIIASLAIIGPGFMLIGLAAMFVGPLNLLVPGVVEIRAPWPSPLAEMSVFYLGIVLVITGTIANGLLWLYVRFMRGVFLRLLSNVRRARA